MVAKQLSVFIENRKGRLNEVLHFLKENKINVMSLSLADTTEFGLLRLIIDSPEKSKTVLEKAGFSCMLTEVLVVKIVNQTGSLQVLLDILSNNDINIEYMYGLTAAKDVASIVIKPSDIVYAEEILTKNGATTLSNEDILKI